MTYNWSSGTTNSLDNYNFIEGENYVTVTDASGCEAVASYFVENSPLLCGTLDLLVYYDVDNNCVLNGLDYRLQNFKIRIETANGQNVYYGNSYNFINGLSYSKRLNPGDYMVSVELPNSLWQGCQASYPVTLTAGSVSQVDVPLQAVEPCASLVTSLSIQELNWCSPYNYATIAYNNQGTADAVGAYIELQLEDHITISSTVHPFTDLGNNLYRFDLGTLAVGESGHFTLALKVDCSATMGATPCISVTIFPNEPCPSAINANWSGASLRVSSQCEGNEVKFVIENVGAGDMTAPLGYVIIEDAVMFMDVPNDPPLPQGGTKEITLPANGATWRIEVEQEALHPGESMPALTLEGCDDFGSQGLVNLFPPNDADDYVDIECVTISGPYDPNDKQGLPLGVGDDHLIRPGTDIEYMIRFQNTGTDTAETVVIRDTLDQWLDPLSIEPGAASHPYRFDYFGEGGQIKFTFENIMLLDSNLNEPASHGFVKFRIKHLPNIPLGTDIHNQAAIYFDYNPPIFTNTTQHSIGEIFLLQSTSEPGFEHLNLTVKPNPVEGQATITVQGSEDLTGLHAELFDAFGRPVVNLAPTHDGFLLDRGGLPSGIYFVRVVGKDGAAVAAAKVMVR
ncbi:MAG: T9SS type A sorting domain-containing protein [Saprospiraceae bacterium]|nr:T9SS type A sorting domain-containing protein [Saprospiraceae bacterium]